MQPKHPLHRRDRGAGRVIASRNLHGSLLTNNRGGKVRITAYLLIIALAAGCASPPPTIDRGEYQNYRYGFIVQLPREGWERTGAVPERFAAALVPEAPERLLLLLHNPGTGGLIAVRGGSLVLSYENALNLQERLSGYIESFLDQERRLIVRDGTGGRGSYAVEHCDASGLQWRERPARRPPAGIRHASRGYVYPLKGEACYVTFTVFSQPDTFDRNAEALDRMAATFSSGEVFTTRVYGR